MPRLFLPAIIALTCCISLQGNAAERLDAQKIEAFYEGSVNAQLAGKQEALAYFKKHLANDVQMTMHFYSRINGSTPQKRSITYTKGKILEQTKQGYETGQLLQINNKVLSVDVSNDGRSAEVKDSTMVISVLSMPNPQGGGMIKVRSEQTLLCTSQVALNKKDILQSKKSVCNVDSKVEKIN